MKTKLFAMATGMVINIAIVKCCHAQVKTDTIQKVITVVSGKTAVKMTRNYAQSILVMSGDSLAVKSFAKFGTVLKNNYLADYILAYRQQIIDIKRRAW